MELESHLTQNVEADRKNNTSKMSIKSPIGGFELATQAMVSINARAHENPSSLTLSQIAISHGIPPLPPLQSSFVFLRAA